MKTPLAIIFAAGLTALAAHGQVLLSAGTNYTQNFDSLENSASGKTSASWTNNATLPGWYARSEARGDYTSYRISNGEQRDNGLYSFGSSDGDAVKDRALGSIASASPQTIAFGVRFKNDTQQTWTNVVVSCVGEQWRNSTSNAADQTLSFWHRVSDSPITDPQPGVREGWTAVRELYFTRLHYGHENGPLDGNAAANRTRFENVQLPGVSVKPGQELFLRWVDVDDEGQNDHGLAIDELRVAFTPVAQ
jgi:hypothetical protein